MKKLYLVRHGQTVLNHKLLLQGQMDSPLTEKGIEQVLQAKEKILNNNIKYDHVFTSPLGRAIQTTKLITDNDYEVVDGIVEMSYGSLEGEYYNVRDEHFGDYKNVGGEDFKIVGKRMFESLYKIMNKDDVNNALVITHGDAMRCFYLYANNNEQYEEIKITNCEIFEYDFDGTKFNFVKKI